jgi:hypothetical protein
MPRTLKLNREPSRKYEKELARTTVAVSHFGRAVGHTLLYDA